MKRHVRLLASAQADLDRLADWLIARDPRAAERASQALAAGVRSLAELSERGRAKPGTPYRELFVPFGRDGYVIRYRVDAHEVLVGEIFHGRERR